MGKKDRVPKLINFGTKLAEKIQDYSEDKETTFTEAVQILCRSAINNHDQVKWREAREGRK